LLGKAPEVAPTGAVPTTEEERVSGAFLLATVFKVVENNPDHRLVVVGHCDTTGKQDYNQDLSVQRAQCVQSLLEGKPNDFQKIAAKTARTLDVQRLLQYYARACIWGCNPGPLDDTSGPSTEAAVRSFRAGYKQSFVKDIGKSSKTDNQFWGAVFDLYQREIASVLGVSLADLSSLQGQLKFMNAGVPAMGCGELFPMEAVGVDNYFSRRNRRFEVLFAREAALGNLPELTSTASHDFYAAAQKQSGHLRPIMRGSDPLAELLEDRDTLVTDQELIDVQPGDELVTSSDCGQSDGSDWGFLDLFAAHHPGVGGVGEPRSRA
jgi:hypothetical protein